MTDVTLGLAALYASSLRTYLDHPGEQALHQGYELGRDALEHKAGILDLIALHHDILAELLANEPSGDASRTTVLAAEFLSEFLSSFEMTLRSYLEMNTHLSSVNAELINANAAAISANDLLLAEVAERERVEQALLHAQKLQAVGLLAGGVAHNFNNLLTVVLGNIDLARGLVTGNAKADQYLQAAERGAERGAEITRELLTFSRQQKLQPRVLALGEWLQHLTPVIAAALRDDITIENHVGSAVWPIEIDPSQLELAILNLCVNARHAMAHGGIFRLSAENRHIDDAPRGLQGDFVVISVSDTGQGIAPDLLHRVFEPFFTTKKQDPGTGLGLSQVHGFVHQSGGGVEMESVLGEGATVHLYLPASVKQITDATSDAPQLLLKKSSGSVLVVEDDPEVADVAVALLRERGYSVSLALRAQTALDMIQGEVRVDLIFSDVVMPGGMSGVQLAEEVRRRFPKLSILLTTGYSEALAGAHAEGHEVITKPYRSEDLCARIEEMLRPTTIAA